MHAHHLSSVWGALPMGWNCASPHVLCVAECCCLSSHFGTPLLAHREAGAGVCTCTVPLQPQKCKIDISVHAEGEWQWSIYNQGKILHTLQYPNGEDTNHCSATQGLLFLSAWQLLAFLLGENPEDIFLPCFNPRYPQRPWKVPSW